MTMDQLEITQEYQTDYGSSRVPTEGNKFLWVHVRLRDIAQTQLDVPVAEHFSVLYAATELKPTYGHRAGYTDYTLLGPTIFPNQELDGWLRFDIPAAASRARCCAQRNGRSAMADAKSDPLHYLNEIRDNVNKMRAQGKVTPTENALFGMVDGTAGLMLFMLNQMADMRKRLDELESRV